MTTIKASSILSLGLKGFIKRKALLRVFYIFLRIRDSLKCVTKSSLFKKENKNVRLLKSRLIS